MSNFCIIYTKRQNVKYRINNNVSIELYAIQNNLIFDDE
jgi:hypothetical protein